MTDWLSNRILTAGSAWEQQGGVFTYPALYFESRFVMISKIGKLIKRNIPLTLAIAVVAVSASLAAMQQIELLRIKGRGNSTALAIGKANDKFTVNGATGNTTVAGTMSVAGATTFTGVLTGTGGFTTPGNYTTTGTGSLVVGGTGTATVAGLSTLTGGVKTNSIDAISATELGIGVATATSVKIGGSPSFGTATFTPTAIALRRPVQQLAFAWADVGADAVLTGSNYGKVNNCTVTGAQTITMPATDQAGTCFYVFKADAAALTFKANSAGLVLTGTKADGTALVAATSSGTLVSTAIAGQFYLCLQTASNNWFVIPLNGSLASAT